MIKHMGNRLRVIFTGGMLAVLVPSLVFLPAHSAFATLTSVDFNAVPLTAGSNTKVNVLIILDNSQSMGWSVDSTPPVWTDPETGQIYVCGGAPNSRSEIARTAVKTVIANNQNSLRFGLMTYAQRGLAQGWFSKVYYNVSYCQGCQGDDPDDNGKRRTESSPISDNPQDGKIYYYPGYDGYGYIEETLYCFYQNGSTYVECDRDAGEVCPLIYPYICCSEKTVGPLTLTTKPTHSQFPEDLEACRTVAKNHDQCKDVMANTEKWLRENYGYGGDCQFINFLGADSAVGPADVGREYGPWGQEWVIGGSHYTIWNSDTPGKGRLQVDIADPSTDQTTLLYNKLAREMVTEGAVDAELTEGPNDPVRNAGGTPIPGTLQSALEYFEGQTSNPDLNPAQGVTPHNPIQTPCQKNYVILVTDGLPSTMPDGSAGTNEQLYPAAIQQVKNLRAVKNSAVPVDTDGSPKTFDVKTFVVGFALGESNQFLNDLANAGGTGSAYNANDADQLNAALSAIFKQISNDASSGTSAAINTNSRSGEGGAFPTAFYPKMQDKSGHTIHWAGDVVALFVDKSGRLREDTNGDHILRDTGDSTHQVNQIVSYQKDAVAFATPVDAITEKMTLTMPAVGVLAGKYFFLNASGGRRYYVCFNVDHTAVADSEINKPGQAYRQRLEVTLAATDDAATGARRTARVLNNSMVFKAKAASNQLTIETVLPGSVEDMTAGNSGIPFTIDRQGYEPSSGDPTLGNKTGIKYLWSASDWLASISDTDIVAQRAYNSKDKKRYIITFVDKGNGIPADPLGTPFTPDGLGADINLIPISEQTSARIRITGVPDGTVVEGDMQKLATRVINFIRGQDQGPDTLAGGAALPASRSRQIEYNGWTLTGPGTHTWRLGDIIHSNPLAVDRPNQGDKSIYGDNSYATFQAKYANRRTVIYVGANDGMLHAFNGGFYENRYSADLTSTSNPVMRYLPQPVKQPVEWQDGKVVIDTNFKDYDLGAELWAYVPYNLLGHLHWLTETGGDANSQVNHVYYVDLEPVAYDVQMFPDDADHPGGWGTILVGGMGFGGGSIDSCVKREWSCILGCCAETRAMSSAYFIFDITNPEKEPKLLIEFALPRQGYTTSIPTLAYFKDKKDPSINQAFLVFGSGPASAAGLADSAALRTANSAQQARLFYLRLPSPGQSLSSASSWGVPGGALDQCRADSSRECSLKVIGGNPAYVSDMVAIDTDLDYKTDVLYYGTVVSPTDSSSSLSGALRRIATNASKYPNDPRFGLDPSNWNSDSVLIDLAAAGLKQPISATANTSFDGKGNLFVYFGTGRYLADNDQFNNDQQAFYGVKEPRGTDGKFTWETVAYANLYDSTEVRLNIADENGVEVTGGTGTNISWRSFLADMDSRSGWVRKLRTQAELNMEGITGTAERAVNQPAITSQLFLTTTFVPTTDDACDNLGRGYLYALYYRSGTAAMSKNGPMTSFYDLGGGLPARPSVTGDMVRIANSTGNINAIKLGEKPLGDNGKPHHLDWETISE